MTATDIKKEIEALGDSREAVVAAAELAQRALDLGELGLFVRAKSREAQAARFLGMHQHGVVTCAELMEIMPRFLALPEIDEEAEKRLVWGLKYGAGSAMDLPEIPLATVRELLGALDRALDRFGRTKVALWELSARLAFIEADAEALKDLVAKISPQVSLHSHLYDHADCPGCTLLQVARWLGPDAPAEEVEAVLEPVFSGKPFARDAPMARVYELLYGDSMCENAKRLAPVLLARAHARSGRLAEARREAAQALDRAGATEERRVRALVAAISTEIAAGDLAALGPHAEDLGRLWQGLEDPYEALDAAVELFRARMRLGEAQRLPALRDEALALARRLDARLPSPRHERETLAALGRG